MVFQPCLSPVFQFQHRKACLLSSPSVPGKRVHLVTLMRTYEQVRPCWLQSIFHTHLGPRDSHPGCCCLGLASAQPGMLLGLRTPLRSAGR